MAVKAQDVSSIFDEVYGSPFPSPAESTLVIDKPPIDKESLSSVFDEAYSGVQKEAQSILGAPDAPAGIDLSSQDISIGLRAASQGQLPEGPLGDLIAGLTADVVGTMSLPFTGIKAITKNPLSSLERDLFRRGTATAAGTVAAVVGGAIAGPVGAGALGGAVFTAVGSPEDKPIDTAIGGAAGAGLSAAIEFLGPVLGKISQRTGSNVGELMGVLKRDKLAPSDLAVLKRDYGINPKEIVAIKEAQRKLPLDNPLEPPSPETIPRLAKALRETDIRARGNKTEINEVPINEITTRLSKAIREAGPSSRRQRELISEERSRRAAEVTSEMIRVGGEKGYFAALSRLKGIMPKAHFESVRDMFSQGEIDKLFNLIGMSSLRTMDKITAQRGLQKLLGMEGGIIPTQGELSMLKDVMGPELIEAAVSRRPLMSRIGVLANEIINVPRSIQSSMDFSAVGRQGIMMVSRPEYWAAISPSIRAFGSKRVFNSIQEEILQRPSYPLMREAKLAITNLGKDAAEREEIFISHLAEKLPIAGPLIRASERSYVGFLNKVRADVFDNVVLNAQKAKIKVDREFIEGLAKWINVATGRGNLGAFENHAVTLNSIFYSPRLIAARVQTLNPMFYTQLPEAIRREALKTHMASAAIVAALTSMVAIMANGQVVLDPRRSDFGRAQLGKTRIDFTGGHGQYIRLFAQLLSGEVMGPTTETIRKLNAPGYSADSRLDVIERFLKNKLNPINSLVVAMLSGKDFKGQPIEVQKEIASRLTPMVFGDVIGALQEFGPAGVAVIAPAILGVGVQTYTEDEPQRRRPPSRQRNDARPKR